MKKILYIISAIAIMFSYACEPQKDVAPDLGPAPTGDFAIDNSDPNYVILKATGTDAFLYTWNLGNGLKAEGQTVNAYYPFNGDYTIILTISGKAGATIVQKSLNVPSTDPLLVEKPGIKELTNSGAGQTWVFYKDNPDPEGAFFFMTANYDWDEFWWDPVVDDCCRTPEISEDSVRFDLDGAFNYTVYHNGEATKGTFIYNDDEGTIQLVDANLPYYEINEEEGLLNQDVFSTGIFDVHTLTSDEVWLWQDQTNDDYDYGWMWVFVPKNN